MRGDLNLSHGLHRFPAPLDARVNELATNQFWLHGRWQRVNIEALNTGCGEFEAQTSKVDRFKVRWQHGGLGVVSWWVILNSSQPGYPPDFIFHDPNFLPPMEKLQSLARWDASSPNALFQVFEELIVALQLYELRKIPEAIRREYEGVIIAPEVVTKYCSSNVSNAASELAEFWIRLRFDEDPVLYTDLHYKMANRQCTLTCDLSQGLFSTIGKLRFVDVETSLEKMVKRVYEHISQCLASEKKSIHRRREVLDSVLSLQGDSLLEVDMERFRSIRLLLKHEEVYVEVLIQLPPLFLEATKIIEFVAKDAYNQRRELRQERSVTGKDPMAIARETLVHTNDMTVEIAQYFLDKAGQP
ncbi:hypothetical protein BIW11_10354 [Tropilaelaps mercedesae]|uniref:BRISC and BRCA1-A complex member 2 n=1 Tax=Tropilaelaps mercedesae TaxID=418985 RepID=A0A1V9XG17_9ACAR|nr:hypothetical protein BIW11_10354 [Tropilaelaps mercedesae]